MKGWGFKSHLESIFYFAHPLIIWGLNSKYWQGLWIIKPYFASLKIYIKNLLNCPHPASTYCLVNVERLVTFIFVLQCLSCLNFCWWFSVYVCAWKYHHASTSLLFIVIIYTFLNTFLWRPKVLPVFCFGRIYRLS